MKQRSQVKHPDRKQKGDEKHREMIVMRRKWSRLNVVIVALWTEKQPFIQADLQQGNSLFSPAT